VLFAIPGGCAGSSVQAVIASSCDIFSSVWQSADGYPYGVTFNEIVDLGGIGPEGDSTRGTQDYLNRDNVEVLIDCLVHHLFFLFILSRPEFFGCA
jgi:HEAT repeat-containing protein 5